MRHFRGNYNSTHERSYTSTYEPCACIALTKYRCVLSAVERSAILLRTVLLGPTGVARPTSRGFHEDFFEEALYPVALAAPSQSRARLVPSSYSGKERKPSRCD